jgi:hypothetical protein
MEVMALGGYSALLIDQEHGPTELQMIHTQTLAAEARGAQVMVRVPSHDPNHAKRLLDLGIANMMFPMVDSVADAQAVVAACYYPPRGRRGLATGGIRASGYGADTKGYFDGIPTRQMLMAQIETPGGLEACEDRGDRWRRYALRRAERSVDLAGAFRPGRSSDCARCDRSHHCRRQGAGEVAGHRSDQGARCEDPVRPGLRHGGQRLRRGAAARSGLGALQGAKSLLI